MRICPMLLSLIGLRRFRDARARHTASAERLGAEADRLASLTRLEPEGAELDATMRRMVESIGP